MSKHMWTEELTLEWSVDHWRTEGKSENYYSQMEMKTQLIRPFGSTAKAVINKKFIPMGAYIKK
jgi:hypothetical protein